LLWQRTVAAQRVTSVTFSADGKTIAAGSSEGLVEVINVDSGSVIRTVTTARTGNPRAIRFARNGDLRVVDDGLTFTVFPAGAQAGQTRKLDGKLLASAALGPRVEYGPLVRRDLIVLGFASGDIWFDSEAGTERVAAHARPVVATALTYDGRLAATGAEDGSLAIWDLQKRSDLVVRRAPPGGELVALSYDSSGKLMVATRSQDTANLATVAAGSWQIIGDLATVSTVLAGRKSVFGLPPVADAQGAVELVGALLDNIVFSEHATHVAWIMRGGAVFHAPSTALQQAVLLSREANEQSVVAISASGRYVYLGQADGSIAQFDTQQLMPTPRRAQVPTGVRSLAVAGRGSFVFVGTEDGTLREIDFSNQLPVVMPGITLGGTAGRLVRDPETNEVFTAGVGASAGVDVGYVRDTQYRRLHTRRLGGAAASMAISNMAATIAVGDFDGRLHLWDLSSFTPMATLTIAA
jgi:WD40 repeat protein